MLAVGQISEIFAGRQSKAMKAASLAAQTSSADTIAANTTTEASQATLATSAETSGTAIATSAEGTATSIS